MRRPASTVGVASSDRRLREIWPGCSWLHTDGRMARKTWKRERILRVCTHVGGGQPIGERRCQQEGSQTLAAFPTATGAVLPPPCAQLVSVRFVRERVLSPRRIGEISKGAMIEASTAGSPRRGRGVATPRRTHTFGTRPVPRSRSFVPSLVLLHQKHQNATRSV